MPRFELTVKGTNGRERQRFIDAASADEAMHAAVASDDKVVKITRLPDPPAPVGGRPLGELTERQLRQTIAWGVVRGGLYLVLINLIITVITAVALWMLVHQPHG